MFIAPNASVYGDVILAKDVTIWFNCVLRGDTTKIIVSEASNIQDGTIVHGDAAFPVTIGKRVTIGHQCVIHGCQIADGALIGMGSVILNGAQIGENSLVGAGSLVTEKTVIPANMLAFGRPAKVIRPLTPAEIAKNHENAVHYCTLGQAYLAGEYQQIKK